MSNTRFSGVLKNTRELTAEPETRTPEPQPRGKVGRPPGKKTNPAYRQVTVYLQENVHREARKLLLDDHRQFSDLVNDLVAQWIQKRH
jgi:hypothetical protein